MNFLRSFILFLSAIAVFVALFSVAIERNEVVRCHNIKDNIENHGAPFSQEDAEWCARYGVAI